MEPNDADWYANLLWLDRRKCLLLVHAGTLFSVFAPDVRKAHLAPIGPLVVRLIERELHAEDLPLDCFGDLDPRCNACEDRQPDCLGLHERDRAVLRLRDR